MCKETVTIKYSISMSTCVGSDTEDEIEVDKDEWEAMSDDEKEAYGNECIEGLVADVVSGYWEVVR